jgi:hypothetical protein
MVYHVFVTEGCYEICILIVNILISINARMHFLTCGKKLQ